MTVTHLTDGNDSGANLGRTAASLIAMYGATPVSQRASSIQAASVVSASSFITVAANHAAWAAEVAATLTAIGAWKGAA
jgi:hypothetical protein